MTEFFPISDAAVYLAVLALVPVCVLLFRGVGFDLRRAPAYLLANARWIAYAATLVGLSVHALMLAPVPPAGSHCVETHHVWGPLEMVLTCDSHAFILAARHPGRLSMAGSYRQGRPIQIFAAALLTLAEAPNPDPWSHELPPGRDPDFERGYSAKLGRIFPYPYRLPLPLGWLPFVALNFLLLVIAVLLFRRLNAPASRTGAATLALLAPFLTFSDPVKGFFWSAHTQMWNVLMPLISIALSAALLGKPLRSWRFMAAAGALLGIGTLTYGSVLLCVPAALLAVAVAWRREPRRPPQLPLLARLLAFLAAFAVPLLVWGAILERAAGGVFTPETHDFRQFVWALDAWKAGGAPAAAAQTLAHLSDFLVHWWHEVWPALMLVGVVLLVGLPSAAVLKATLADRARLLTAAGITLAVCLPFFALMGFYRDRLAFNAGAPVLVAASVLLIGLIDRLPPARARLAVALAAVAAAAFIASALLRVTWPY